MRFQCSFFIVAPGTSFGFVGPAGPRALSSDALAANYCITSFRDFLSFIGAGGLPLPLPGALGGAGGPRPLGTGGRPRGGAPVGGAPPGGRGGARGGAPVGGPLTGGAISG